VTLLYFIFYRQTAKAASLSAAAAAWNLSGPGTAGCGLMPKRRRFRGLVTLNSRQVFVSKTVRVEGHIITAQGTIVLQFSSASRHRVNARMLQSTITTEKSRTTTFLYFCFIVYVGLVQKRLQSFLERTGSIPTQQPAYTCSGTALKLYNWKFTAIYSYFVQPTEVN